MRLGKKVQPAKRAWKKFSTKLKLNNIPKAIKATFKHITRRTPHAASSNHHVDLIANEGGESSMEEDIETIEDAWKIVVAKSSHDDPMQDEDVDQKAEEFISKFYQGIRKEMSLLEWNPRR
ncbi:uncharacterized protein LOC130726708 [Lotus japonicus]|uniref:uncharacterized protein LOC130726708 n=1 Tax=Lotus japonicus TaxID=34305 RepID=UPI0025886567|nr:uncharacterized protein LOC130726708 [Lotus japonicus]